MTYSAIFDSIRAAELEPAAGDLELYRKGVWVTPSTSASPVRLSVIDVMPEQPEQTVVLIHGFAASSAWWRHQMRPLSQRNRVIAIEMRGHGQSSRPKGGYTLSQMVDDTAAALKTLGVNEPVVVAGHSAGGFIAADFALRYPERVGKVILIATPIAIELDSLPLYARVLMRYPDFLLRLMQPFYEMDPKGRADAYLLGIKRLFENDLVVWDGERKFPNLTQPALVIVGDRDYAFPEAYYTRVAELIPNAELVNVGVSKHQVVLERPKAVLRAVERFIETDVSARFKPLWRSENDDVDSVRLLAERPWVARYEGDVPPTLDIPQVSLPRLLRYAARRCPRRPAIRYRGQVLSYHDLDTEVSRFARALRQLGVKRGACVLLLLPNGPHFAIAYHGTLRLGAIAVLCDPREEVDEVARRVRQTGAQVLVTLDGSAQLAKVAGAASGVDHVITANEGDYGSRKRWKRRRQIAEIGAQRSVGVASPPQKHPWLYLMDRVSEDTQPEPGETDVHPGDVAVVTFTAGTTGSPKGVLLTHRNLVANSLQVGTWLSGVTTSKRGVLCAIPFSHGYGMALGVNAPIYLAARMEMLPEFDPLSIMGYIKRHKPAVFVATPAIYGTLNGFSDIRDYVSGATCLCISGTAPLPVEVKEAFERLAKAQLIESYGLSEAGPLTHISPLHGCRTGSVGLPLPATEARVVALDDGAPLPHGQVGEMLVRGPQVMQGYWQDETATRAVLDADGWMHTGDVARIDDDGYFQILGRRQDAWMDDDGNLVFPRDVAEVIYELPEVNEVVVIGIDGEPVAFVRLHADEHISAGKILEFCERRLSPNHTPRRVVFVDKLLRSHIGKVLTHHIIDVYRENGPADYLRFGSLSPET
jgi:long-chain acyl-CoA synthetase